MPALHKSKKTIWENTDNCRTFLQFLSTETKRFLNCLLNVIFSLISTKSKAEFLLVSLSWSRFSTVAGPRNLVTKSLLFMLSVLCFLLSQARWMESLTIVANSPGVSGRGCFQASFFIDHILAFTLTGIVLQTHCKKVSDFPIPNRGRMALTKLSLAEKSLTFFYSAVWKQPVSRLPRSEWWQRQNTNFFACLLLIEESPRHFPVQFRANTNCNSRSLLPQKLAFKHCYSVEDCPLYKRNA